MELRELTYMSVALRIFLAIIIGGLIGLDRGMKNRPAGLRTYMLVCLGSCLVMMTNQFIYQVFTVGDPARMSAQVVSGIGFLGAGTILFSDRKITGLTTAASLWNTACLGIAIGFGYYVIAIAGSLFVFFVLILMQRIIHVRVTKKLEVRFVHRIETIEYINHYFEARGIQTVDIDFHVTNTDDRNVYTNIYSLQLPHDVTYTEIVNNLSEHANILSIRTTSI